jgi:3-oxoacyl-[acyl-carrier protein] reductase
MLRCLRWNPQAACDDNRYSRQQRSVVLIIGGEPDDEPELVSHRRSDGRATSLSPALNHLAFEFHVCPTRPEASPGQSSSASARHETERDEVGNQELAGRVAIVTGAGRNIGSSIARSLARAGAAVVVNARANEAEAEAVVRDIEASGGRAMAAIADVVDAAAVENMVADAISRFGGIDILVNNAAIRAEQPLGTMTLDEWRKVLAVVLDGAFICTKACLPHLAMSDAASIVNVGGLSAHTGAAHRAHVVTGKAGLIGFTRALAHEFAGQIRVNMVTPGLMQTPRPPNQTEPQHHSFSKPLVGRRGRPEDIAEMVRFLAGPRAGFITGQNHQLNGGAHLR